MTEEELKQAIMNAYNQGYRDAEIDWQGYESSRDVSEEPKQETLEEAAENKYGLSDKYSKNRIGFIEGAKWQQERSYSEEEVYHILVEHTAFLFQGGKSTLTEWFEQFKKK